MKQLPCQNDSTCFCNNRFDGYVIIFLFTLTTFSEEVYKWRTKIIVGITLLEIVPPTKCVYMYICVRIYVCRYVCVNACVYFCVKLMKLAS